MASAAAMPPPAPEVDRESAAADEVRVGVLVAPAIGGFAEPLIHDVCAEMTDRHPEVRWHVEAVEDLLVQPPADDSEIVRAARARLLDRAWDLALCLTDLPLRVARRAVIAHASPVYGVAVLSVPALGTVGVRRRARDAVVRLLEALLGEGDAHRPDDGGTPRSRRVTRRLAELASEATDGDAIRFTTRVLTGHLRLLAGMVRANRPWRLAARLSRALTAAGAAGALAVVYSDIWRLADALGWVRLVVLTIGALGALTATLIVGAGLWERSGDRRVRQQVVLFNLATSATVVIGVVALYAALFVLALPSVLLLVPPRLFAAAVGHPVTTVDYLHLAWLTASVATVGGALGAGLETDEAVRQAAYTYRTSATTERGTH